MAHFSEADVSVAFWLIDMALAIQATHDPWRYCNCGASYTGPGADPARCFLCTDEQTPEWQAWAKAAGVGPRKRTETSSTTAPTSMTSSLCSGGRRRTGARWTGSSPSTTTTAIASRARVV